MPSGKHRSKEDTWKEDELKQAIQGSDDKSRSKSDRKRDDRGKERSSRRDDETKERRTERRDKENDDRRKIYDKDDVINGSSDRQKRRDRDSSNKDRERVRERDLDGDHDKERRKDRDRERKREKERRREKDGSRERTETDRSREKRERDETKETRRERDRDEERRKDRSRDKDGERRRDKDQERERDRERKERDREKDQDRKERGRERERGIDKDKREREGENDTERDKERRDRDGEKDRERRKERDGKRRREHQDKEGDVSHKDDRKGNQDRGEHQRRDGEHREKRDRKRDKERDREKDDRSKHEEDGSREKRHREKRKEQSKEPSDEPKRRSHERRDKSREMQDASERDPESIQASDGRKRRSTKHDRESSDADSKAERGTRSHDDKVKQREREMLASLKKEEGHKSHISDNKTLYKAATLEENDAIDVEEETTSSKSNTTVTRKPSVANADEINEDDNAYDYEDDFEDYEEDFEEDGETSETDLPKKEELNELLRAIHAENEDVRTFSREGNKSISSRSSDDEPRESKRVRPSTGRGRINFVAAKQKQISEKVASRTKKRGQELMHLIDLDVASFDIFDLPPLNEYELYIKNFGRTDTRQAYVQCNEDNVDREVQSEEIETSTKWVQYPSEGFLSCGGEDDSANSGDYTIATENTRIDSVHLTRFLEGAGQVCLVLLEEAAAAEASTTFKDKQDMACSDGYIQLDTKQSYLEGRKIEDIYISPVKTHLLLAAYGPISDKRVTLTKVTETLQNKSVVCLWNINEPSKPQKILVCESIPRCCCLSPLKATLAFAGLDDGSLIAWDLREPASLHRTAVVGGNMVLRSPTFSTAGVMPEDNHHSPVRSVLPVLSPGDSAKASMIGASTNQEDMLGLSFQLASLEENAVINIWVVVELEKADVAGSETDLGLAPGGKIKIVKSASLALVSPFRELRKKTSLQTFTMQFLPQDPNHIYVGTDAGYVLHSIRYGTRSPPKAYRAEVDCLIDVTTIAVSPWNLPCILAGYRDGTLRLYNLQNDTPLMTWQRSTGGSPVVRAQWSRSRPGVFYVLDKESRLYVWDLLQKETEPVAVEKFKHSQVVAFDLSSDYSATGIGMAGRHAELILGYESGALEVHRINQRFSTTSADELDRFASFLDGLF